MREVESVAAARDPDLKAGQEITGKGRQAGDADVMACPARQAGAQMPCGQYLAAAFTALWIERMAIRERAAGVSSDAPGRSMKRGCHVEGMFITRTMTAWHPECLAKRARFSGMSRGA